MSSSSGSLLIFFQNVIDLFQFQVNDVVHHPLCFMNMVNKKIAIKAGIRGKGFIYIAVKIDGQQATAIIRT